MKVTKQQIKEQLIDIGLERGDVVFVGADLMNVGYFNKNIETTLRDWVEIFDSVLGDAGTIVIPAYSPTYVRFLQTTNFIYSKSSPSNSGSLTKAYLNYATNFYRGSHPTASCIVKGRFAEFIINHNSPKSLKYDPYGCVVQLKGKGLLLGTLDTRNGPFTFHYAQQLLGHTKKHPYSGLLQTKYLDEQGDVRNFIVREIGGCTGGLHRAWGYHLEKKAVKFSLVGRSMSALIDAEKSTEIFQKLLTTKPYGLQCDNVRCLSCYGRFQYNGIFAYAYYLRSIPFFAKKFFKKIARK